jgi:hypothetical protein
MKLLVMFLLFQKFTKEISWFGWGRARLWHGKRGRFYIESGQWKRRFYCVSGDGQGAKGA